MGKEKDDNLYLDRVHQLKKFYFHEDRLPSIIEMRNLFHVSSQSAVQAFMLRATHDGLVRKDGKAFLPTDELVGIPAYDDARGGIGTDVKDVEKHQIVLAKFLVDNPLTTRFAKVAGDSMDGAGIMEWDFVIVDTAKRAREWDMIFVINHGSADRLVKYYEKDTAGRPVLKSANPRYRDIAVTREMEIAGVVIGSFRRF